MNTRSEWGGVARTSLDPPQEPHYRDEVEAHLSSKEMRILRWRGDFAESAEMRRAYSAMYGRYFSRALLASRFGFTDFVPLSRNRTIITSAVEESGKAAFEGLTHLRPVFDRHIRDHFSYFFHLVGRQ